MMTNELAKWAVVKAKQVLDRDIVGAEEQLDRLHQVTKAWGTIKNAVNAIESAAEPWMDPVMIEDKTWK